MQVIKKNGKLEELNLNKIEKRIRTQAKDLKIDTLKIIQEVVGGLKDKMTTTEIDNYIVEVATSYTTQHYHYSTFAVRIAVSRLHKHTYNSFETVTRKLSKSKLLNKKYLEILNREKDLERIESEIKYESDYDFSIFGLKTLMKSYLLKDNEGKILERPQQMFMRVALTLSYNLEDAIKYYHLLREKYASAATPILFNSGAKRQQLSSCILISNFGDSLEAINDTYKDTSRHSADAAGIGLCFDNQRSKSSKIATSNGNAAGVFKNIKVYNELARMFNQQGKRNGSFAMYLSVWHKDIMDIMDIRKNTGKDELRARDVFTAVVINDLFMERLEKDEFWTLFCPNDIIKNGGKPLQEVHNQEFRELYSKYESDPKFKGVKIKASEIARAIYDSQIQTGTPYIMYKDVVNRATNHSNIGTVIQSNLCVAPETQILTKEGYIEIGKNEGKEVEVWNGEQWSKTKIVKTGENQKLLKVTLSNGKHIWATEYHKWYDWKLRELRTTELYEGVTLETFILPDGMSVKVDVVSVDGERYDDTYCVNEPLKNKVVFNGVLTGNCIEIMQYTDSKTIANCTLSALPVHNFYKNGKYDFELLGESAYIITKALNVVIDKNAYSTKRSRKGGLEQRAIGVGLLGLADLFAKMKIDFGSQESKDISNKIMETIYFHCIRASNDLAKNQGIVYKYFEGSDFSKGIFQMDYYTDTKLSGMWDWDSLRESVKKYGMANSLLTALMPTQSTSNIINATECFEPFYSNIMSRIVIAGEIPIINQYLIEDLEQIGLWTEDVRKAIIMNEGKVYSVSDSVLENPSLKNIVPKILDTIPSDIRRRYRTAFEISQKDIIDMAADRQRFVDQSQSMNLFMDKPTIAKVSSAQMYAFKKGLKTGNYYLKSKSSLIAGMNLTGLNFDDKSQEQMACSIEAMKNGEDCMMCSG
jgi:ribonucleotide reductase alpha subunit